MLLAGFLLVAMGSISVGVTVPYLTAAGVPDPAVPWLAAGGGAAGIVAGFWWLARSWKVQRDGTSTLVLRPLDRRFKSGAVMLGVCILMLLLALTLDQPTVNVGVPPLLAITFVQLLFQPPALTPESSPTPDAGQSGNTGA